ncbi:MAG: SH3 domain-containing protein [Methylobacterium mesophilicum]|nr:SH3 domain-containing protein [Methylobacterium mesophilicum]
MKRTLWGATALLAAVLLPGIASAAGTAIATGNVNLRAGPSTGYPAVNLVPRGQDVRVNGCLRNRSWCDVSYYGQRGWMSSNFIAFVNGGRRYVGAPAVRYIEAPTVTFTFGDYWDRNYRDRDFYRDRARWAARRDLYDAPRFRDDRPIYRGDDRPIYRGDRPIYREDDRPRYRDRGGYRDLSDNGERSGYRTVEERQLDRRDDPDWVDRAPPRYRPAPPPQDNGPYGFEDEDNGFPPPPPGAY